MVFASETLALNNLKQKGCRSSLDGHCRWRRSRYLFSDVMVNTGDMTLYPTVKPMLAPALVTTLSVTLVDAGAKR